MRSTRLRKERQEAKKNLLRPKTPPPENKISPVPVLVPVPVTRTVTTLEDIRTTTDYSGSNYSESFIFNSQELQCSLRSSPFSNVMEMIDLHQTTVTKARQKNTLGILVDNEEEVIPKLHDLTKPSLGSDSDEVYSTPDEGSIDDVHLTEEPLKKDDTEDEPYKINIPLEKKVNQSTKKKLWREIQLRKPHLTQNVATHIQKFAKPPFITWGCKSCAFPYEIQSYSKEYMQH